MNYYYINLKTDTNPKHNNEVHAEGCKRMPSVIDREYLGLFTDGVAAVNYAKAKGYSKADGCIHCAPEAHQE